MNMQKAKAWREWLDARKRIGDAAKSLDAAIDECENALQDTEANWGDTCESMHEAWDHFREAFQYLTLRLALTAGLRPIEASDKDISLS